MNKKGFTLIELLAVIVVLALILIIAVPRVLNVIEESEKETFRLTGENIVKTASDKGVIDAIDSPKAMTYTITNGSFVGEKLSISGKLPDNGTIKVDENGNVEMAVKNDKYCLRKGKTTSVTLDKDIDNCIIVVLDEVDSSCFTRTKTLTEVTITGYSNTCSKNPIIPEVLDGLPVTTIRAATFYNKQLTNILFPNSLGTIGPDAFRKNLLTDLTIPKNVKKLNHQRLMITCYQIVKLLYTPEILMEQMI